MQRMWREMGSKDVKGDEGRGFGEKRGQRIWRVMG